MGRRCDKSPHIWYGEINRVALLFSLDAQSFREYGGGRRRKRNRRHNMWRMGGGGGHSVRAGGGKTSVRVPA